MKVQHTNQTQLEMAAMDNAWAVVDLINNYGMTIEEAVQAQSEGWMNDPYDEAEFDAPYDIEQIRPIIHAAVVEYMES